MKDGRLNSLAYRNTIASGLFQRVASYDEMDMIQCEEDTRLVFPAPAFNNLSLDDKLRVLAQERANILFASIDIQEQIMLAGESRTINLCMERQRLSHVFQSPEILEGLNADIRQQSTDMVIMTVMSNSALVFAKSFAPDDHEKIDRYSDKVFDMKAKYEEFSARLDTQNHTYCLPADANYTPSDDPMRQLQSDLAEIKELNILLATMVENRFENGIRSLYFWQEKLGQKPQTMKTGHEFFDHFCNPRHEWEYEVEIQGLMRDRVKILTTRAGHMEKYEDLIADMNNTPS